MLGVLLVLLNSDTDFIELIASTRNTQQGLQNMAKVLFFTLVSASAAYTRFGAGLCHQTRAQGCSSALLKSSHFWYHSILRALHRCKFISGSTLQTLQKNSTVPTPNFLCFYKSSPIKDPGEKSSSGWPCLGAQLRFRAHQAFRDWEAELRAEGRWGTWRSGSCLGISGPVVWCPKGGSKNLLT